MASKNSATPYGSQWLRDLFRENPTKKKKQLGLFLCQKFAIKESYASGLITRILKDERKIEANEAEAILEFFSSAGIPQQQVKVQGLRIPVYDLSASAGDGCVMPLHQQPDSYWDLPSDLLPFSVSGRKLAVLSVRGDSMSPELNDGDRVIVDLNDKNPSAAGLFILDDGNGGVVVKRLEFLFHQSPPMIKIISTNKEYSPYVVGIDQVIVSGRVVLKIGRA